MRVPSNSPMTPGYGFGSALSPYSAASPHMGTDFQHTPDNTIYAPFGGAVTQAYNSRDGNGSYMTEPNGRFHGMLHASKYLVPNGATVTEGQPIAVMGDTGFAEGVHLHWCVKENGQFIDPMSLITEGEDMTAANLNDVRIVNAMVVGNDGHEGRPNALAGDMDEALKGWVGQDVQVMLESFYNSAEAQKYREKLLPQVYTDRDTARAEVNELQSQIDSGDTSNSKFKPYSGAQLYVEDK